MSTLEDLLDDATSLASEDHNIGLDQFAFASTIVGLSDARSLRHSRDTFEVGV